MGVMVALPYNFMVQRFLVPPVMLASVRLVLLRLDVTSVADSASDLLSSESRFLEALSSPQPPVGSQGDVESSEKEDPRRGVIYVTPWTGSSALSSTCTDSKGSASLLLVVVVVVYLFNKHDT